MEKMDITTLEKLADTFIESYKKTLSDEGKVASGALVKSIDGDVLFDGKVISVNIYANPTWKYVEYGRKPGKFPNVEALREWIKVKGLPRSNYSPETGGKKLPTQEQLAFLVGRKIMKEGIPAGNYLSDTLKKTGFEQKVKRELAYIINKRLLDSLKEEINDVTTVQI